MVVDGKKGIAFREGELEYLSHVGGERFAMRSIIVGGATTTKYFIADHLGSLAVVTDGTGAVISGGRLTYDPWGKPNTSSPPTTRGFTDHEMIPPGPGVSLINMNARVYDPELARFMSADSVVPDLFDAQTLNRYTYVNNRPLSLTDPSGHGALEILIIGTKFTSFLGPVTTVVSVIVSIFKAIFGGLFGGGHKAALITISNPAPPPPPPNYVAGAGGTPTGIPPPLAEAKVVSGGAAEIKIVGLRTTSVTAHSLASECVLRAAGASEIVVTAARPAAQPASFRAAGAPSAGAVQEILVQAKREPMPQQERPYRAPELLIIGERIHPPRFRSETSIGDLAGQASRALKGGRGDIHACESAFQECVGLAAFLYDMGRVTDSNNLFRGCRSAVRRCFERESQVQGPDLSIKGGISCFPPDAGFAMPAGCVIHTRGSRPVHVPRGRP